MDDKQAAWTWSRRGPDYFNQHWQGNEDIFPRIKHFQHYMRPPVEELGVMFRSKVRWSMIACTDGWLQWERLAPRREEIRLEAGQVMWRDGRDSAQRLLDCCRVGGNYLSFSAECGYGAGIPRPPADCSARILSGEIGQEIIAHVRKISDIIYRYRDDSFFPANAEFFHILDILRRGESGEQRLSEARSDDALSSMVLRSLAASLEFPCSIDDLARRFDISPRSLMQRFRDETGDTIKQTLLRLRIEAVAAGLLAGETVTALAARYQFTDATHLSRTFKKIMSCTPSAYKSQHTDAAAVLSAAADTSVAVP